MRTPQRRVAEAVTGYLARHGQDPDPATLARVVGEAVGAAGCALTIENRHHQWGGGPWMDHAITHGGQRHGVLSLTPESADALPAAAAVLGAPVAAILVAERTDRLRRAGDAAARALADDRWRAAAEMEQERRGLERDLHDGAQHHLVALRMSLALVEHVISGGAGRERITDLVARLDTVERVLVDTAAGILPGTLVADGLAAALRAVLASHDTVRLDLAGLCRRYPTPLESAVFFVVLEAVNNAHKHAAGAQVTVRVRDCYQGLEFRVTDTGPGFAMAAPNAGLPNLAARAASVGGTVEVRSAPGAGTTVSGVVPL